MSKIYSIVLTMVLLFVSGGVKAQQEATVYMNEGFESCTTGSSGTIPAGWDNTDITQGTASSNLYKWYVFTTAHNGSKAAYLYCYYYWVSSARLKTKAISLSPQKDAMVSFWLKNLNDGGDFSLYVSTDSGATYAATLMSHVATGATWTQYEFSLAQFKGQTITLVFEGAADVSTSYYYFLDDILVRDVPTCQAPADISVSNLTASSATLHWSLDTRYGVNPDQFRVTLRDAAGDLVAYNGNVANDGSNTFSFTGLTTGTTYTAYVRSNCDVQSYAGYSDSVPVQFTTLAPAINPPFYEDFDSLIILSSNYYLHNASLSSFTSYGGSGKAVRLATTASDYASIVFPLINIAANDFEMDFWIRRTSDVTTNVVYYVGYLTDPTDIGGSMVPVLIDSLPKDAVWHNVRFNTASVQATTSPIMMCVQIPATLASTFYIDNVAIHAIPPCTRPEHLACSDITDQTVTLTWNMAYATSYIVKAMSSTDTLTQIAAASPFIVTGLTDNTDYTFTVQGVCSATDSSDISFAASCHTECPVAESTTFFEGAEGTTGTDIPNCWKTGFLRRTGTTTYDQPFQTQTTTKKGTRGFTLMKMSSGNIAYMCSQALNFDLSNKYSFRYKFHRPTGNMANEGLKVFVTPTPGDTTNAVEVIPFVNRAYSLPPVSTFGWNTYEGVINYQGIGYIMIVGYSRNGAASNFDDLEVFINQTCLNVSNIAVGNATKNSIDLTWDAGQNETQWLVDYQVKLDTATIIDSADVFVSGQPSVTIAGLNSGTVYSITASIRAYCGVGDTSGVVSMASTSITTQCDAITELPYTMGFEEAETYVKRRPIRHPACWTHYNNSTSTTDRYRYAPYADTSYPRTGSMALYYFNNKNNTSYGDTATYALPEIDTTAHPLNNIRVRFWTRSYSSSYSQMLYIGVMTNPNDPSTFVKVDSVVVNGDTYVEKVAPFNNYDGNGKYIAFAWYKNAITPTYSYSYVYLDDITVEENPACADLTGGITVTDVSDTSMSFTMADQTAANWQYAYGLAGTPVAQMTPVSRNDSNCTVAGLTEATTYDIYVRRDCGATGFGAWSEVTTFSTTAIPAQMPYVCGFEDVQENARWRYVDGAGVNVFTIGSTAAGVYAGSNAICVTTDRTTAPYAYNTSSNSTKSFAYRTLHFDSKVYLVEMKAKCTGGESTFDFGRIFLTTAAENLPSGSTGTTYGSTTFPNMIAEFDEDFTYPGNTYHYINTATYTQGNPDANGWVTIYYFLDMTGRPGNYNLVLMWNNDGGSGAANYPLAVDNIHIRELSCIPPATVAVSDFASTSVNLNIQQNTASLWEVVVNTSLFTKESIPDSVTYRAIVTNPVVSLTGLTPNTDYYYMVRTICGTNDTSDWNELDNFRTFCAVVNLPLTENFEGTNSTNCWNNPDGEGAISRYTGCRHTGAASMKIDGATVVSPELNVTTLVNDMINGWCYATVNNASFQIGVMTDPNDITTYEPLASVLIPEINKWIEFTYYFADLRNPDLSDLYNARYIVIATGDDVVYFDDLNIDVAPTCPKPTEVSITNITANSFDLSFANNATGCTQWIVYLNDVPRVITSTSATITDLMAHTAYNVKIASICSATDTSGTADCGTVTTECDALPTPYTCGFETSEGFSISSVWVDSVLETQCWNTLGMKPASASHPYYNITNTACLRGGTQSLQGYSGSSVYAYYILPPFTDPTDSLVMELWYCNESATASAPYVEIGYMTDASADSTFVMLQQLDKTTTMTKAEQSFIGRSVPGNARIAIRFGGATSQNSYCGIDDILVKRIQSCSDPDIPRVSNITATSAVVAFTDTCVAHGNWEYVYGKAGFDPSTGIPVAVGSARSFTLTGLDDDSYYFVYVRANCGGGEYSNWMPASFRTLCTPFHVTATNMFNESFADYDYNQYLNTGTCFDILGEPTSSSCWAKVYPMVDPYANSIYRYCYGNSADPQDKCLYWYLYEPYISTGSILRRFHLDGDVTYEISAYVRNSSSSSYSSKVSTLAGASTSSLDTLTYAVCDGQTVASVFEKGFYWYYYNTLYEQTKTFFTPDSTGDYYIGFNVDFANSYNYTYLYLDDWTVRALTGCSPRFPAVDSVTTNAAYFSVNDTAFYQFEYVINDTTLTPTVVTHSTFAVNGLSAATSYKMYIRRYCDAATYSAWLEVPFNTACGAVTTFPYTQDFEGAFLPACWSQHYYGDASYANAWTSSRTYHHSGSRCAYIPDKFLGSKTALTTSELMLTSPNGYEVTLWVYRQSTTYQNRTDEGMYIYVSNTPITTEAEANAATKIGFVAAHYANTPAETSAGWYEYTFAIPAALTGSRYVNVCYHNYSGSGSYFDDLTVAEIPSCREPQNAPVVADYTMTTMTVQAAMAGKDAIEFGIAPHFASVTPAAIDTTIISTDGNGVFTGLTGSTRYAVWYRYLCGAEGVSDWSVAFADATTMATDCYAPHNPRTVGVINEHHAEVTWGAAPLAYRFDYELYQSTGTTGVLIDSGSVATADTLVYDSLAVNTNYYFRVCGFCSGDTTAWSTLSFKTTHPVASIPYICGFENAVDASLWEMDANGGDNSFVIGSGTSNGGSRSLYISNDGGTYDYTSNTNQAYARVLLPMTAGNYLVSYDYYCYGEPYYDYGRVFLYPAANAVGCISSLRSTEPIANINVSVDQISGMTGWMTANYIVSIPADAMYYFQINWRDDSAVSNDDPIAIDNISITEIDCMPLVSLTNISTTPSKTKYVATRSEAGIDIQYGYSTVDSQDSITWTTIRGAGLTDTIVLTGLDWNTTYYLFARQACDSTMFSVVTTRVQFTTYIAAQTMPFICGFEPDEAATNAWTFSGANNEFVIGTSAASQGVSSMYISDDGSTWSYDTNSESYSYAYVPLSFGPGTYDIEYEWNANGEAAYDFGRVCLAPLSFVPTAGMWIPGHGISTTPAGWIALDGGKGLNMVADWQTVSIEQTFTDTVVMNLVVSWRNDAAGGTTPPFAIDNIRIVRQLCTSLKFDSIAADTIGEDMFTITFVNPTADAATTYHVSTNMQMSDTVAVGTKAAGDNTFTVTGLQHSTVYYVALYSVCGVDTFSKTLTFDVRTKCQIMSQFPYDEGFEEMTPTITYDQLTSKCWATTAMNSTLYAEVSQTASHFHSGAQGLHISNGSSSENFQILALPEMSNLNGKFVSFWHKAYNNANTYATLSFGYINTSGTFVALDNSINKDLVWQQYKTVVSNLPAGATRLAFKIEGMYDYYLDDIHINDVVQGSTYNDTICYNGAYSAHGFNCPAGSLAPGDTTLNDIISTTVGGQADSIIAVNIFVRPRIETDAYDTICQGQPYNKDGWNIPNPTTRIYFQTHTAVCGCDSTSNLHLYVYPDNQVIYDTICQGDAYQFGDQTLTRTGAYQDSIVSPFGCTTFTTLYLFVVDSAAVTTATICQGDSYHFHGQTYTAGGTYRVTKSGAHGCSVVNVLNLTVLKTDSTVAVTFCKGGSVTVVDTVIDNPGYYEVTRANSELGCSTVYHITATEDAIKSGTASDYACQDHLYYGYGVSGIYLTHDTVLRQTIRDWTGGCDSMIVATIKYVPTVEGITEEASVPADSIYLWHDQSYDKSGYYRDTIPSESTACDSICVLKLTVGGVEPVGVENVEMIEVLVVPNPVNVGQTAFVYVDAEVVAVEILNSFGQVIDRFVPDTYPIEVGGINGVGIYYVRIVTEDEKVVVRKMLVK